jgi:ABC-type lipoprotein release transport system permease subunit
LTGRVSCDIVTRMDEKDKLFKTIRVMLIIAFSVTVLLFILYFIAGFIAGFISA